MFHAFIFATLTACSETGARLQSAEDFLTRSESLIAAKRPGGAGPYHQAEQILIDFPDSGFRKECGDAYNRAVLVTQLRALVAGVAVNEVQPLDAYLRATDLQKLAALAPDRTLQSLDDARWQLVQLIYNFAKPQIAAAHFPTSTSCPVRDMAVDVSQTGFADFPSGASGEIGDIVTVRVRVSVDADGHITDTSLLDSTGSVRLNSSALATARSSQYLPAVKDCRRVPSSYVFSVTFDPNH